MASHSDPYRSSAIPNISSRRGAAVLGGTRNCSPSWKAMPETVPTQSTPVESWSKQFTLSEGSPSLVVYVCQRLCERALNPLGVANQTVPPDPSRIETTVLEA